MASSPSEASIQTQIADVARVTDQYERYLSENAQNYLAHEDTFTKNLETDFADAATAALADFRSNLATNASQAQFEALITPRFREYGRFIDATEVDIQSIFTRLYDLIDRSITVVGQHGMYVNRAREILIRGGGRKGHSAGSMVLDLVPQFVPPEMGGAGGQDPNKSQADESAEKPGKCDWLFMRNPSFHRRSAAD